MIPLARRLRPSSATPRDVTLSTPILRLQARFGKTWGAPGSGFVLADWPQSLITARHVVALADGAPASEIVVKGLVSGKWLRLEALVVAYPPGGGEADDVAIVRLSDRVSSALRMAKMEVPVPAEIHGYPVGSDLPRPPAVVPTRVFPGYGVVALDERARVGMSGGPVVAAAEAGLPSAVVGIYLGPAEDAGGRAFALASDVIIACKDAAKDFA